MGHRDAGRGRTCGSVKIEGSGGLIDETAYDDIQAAFISATVTEYRYYLASVLQKTIEITYQTAAQREIIRARVI